MNEKKKTYKAIAKSLRTIWRQKVSVFCHFTKSSKAQACKQKTEELQFYFTPKNLRIYQLRWKPKLSARELAYKTY